MSRRMKCVIALTALVLPFLSCNLSETTETPTAAGGTSVPTSTPNATRTPLPTATSTPTPSWPLLAMTPVPWPAEEITPANADQIVQMARWGKGTVRRTATAPDGSVLAVLSSLGVHLYETETLEELDFLEMNDPSAVAFSPDGKLLAVAARDGTIELVQKESMEHLRTLEGQTDVIIDMDFAPDGKLLASGADDGTVRVWRVEDGTTEHVIEGTSPVFRLAFSPTGKTLAWGRSDGAILLTDMDEDTPPRMIGEHKIYVLGMAFSPNGLSLVSIGGDNALIFWNVENGTIDETVEDVSESFPLSLALSPDGSTLAWGTYFGTIGVLRIADVNKEPPRALEGHVGPVEDVSFLPDGTLVSNARDGTVRLWEVSTGSELRKLSQHTGYMWCLAFSPDGQTLAAGSEDSSVRLLNMQDGTIVHQLGGERFTNGIASVAFSPDGELLAGGTGDEEIRLWNTSDGTPAYTLRSDDVFEITSLAFSADGQMLVSGSTDGGIRLWDIFGGRPPQLLARRTPEGTAQSAVSPGGVSWALERPSGRLVDIWRDAESKPHGPGGDGENVTSMAFSPDGEVLAIGVTGGPADIIGSVLLWGVMNEQDFIGLLIGDSPAHAIAFSPDGQLLALGLDTGQVTLWSLEDQELIRVLEGHNGKVLAIAFSPDGKLLVSGGDDGTVRVWGIARTE